jgi:glucokinase
MNKIAIGVDIGGTRTKIGLVDLKEGKVIKLAVAPTEKKDTATFIENIESCIKMLLEAENIKRHLIEGIGFGVPSFVFEDGVIDSTYGFIEFMEDYPLVEIIEQHCQLKCKVDNDARMVALGEALYGSAQNYNRVLVLTLGTGLGLGFVNNKKLDGSAPYSHMGGHIKVCENDVACYCGKNGCLESLVSATGIVDGALRKGWKETFGGLKLDAEFIFKKALDGDKDSQEIIFATMWHLKNGIDNYINIYAPDVIVIGGGVAKGMQPYLPMLYTNDVLRPFKSYKTTILLSGLNENSGILGSAALFNN